MVRCWLTLSGVQYFASAATVRFHWPDGQVLIDLDLRFATTVAPRTRAGQEHQARSTRSPAHAGQEQRRLEAPPAPLGHGFPYSGPGGRGYSSRCSSACIWARLEGERVTCVNNKTTLLSTSRLSYLRATASLLLPCSQGCAP